MIPVKQVPSVVDMPAVTIQVKNVLGGTYVPVNASVVAYSGHFKIDATHTLRTQITYVANV